MRKIWIATRFLAFVVMFIFASDAESAYAQVMVIANKSVPVDTLDQSDLYQLFAGDREYWDNDTPVVIVDLAEKGVIRDAFYNFLGKTSSRMRSIWLKRKLTGEGELPTSVESEDVLVKIVSETTGAIGFVSASFITGNEEVKVLISAIPLVGE